MIKICITISERKYTAIYYLGQITRAIEYHEQALKISQQNGYRKEEGQILGNLGLCYVDLGQIARAIEYYEQALEIDREMGYRQGEAIRQGNLGNRYADLGQISFAIECYKKALTIDRELGFRLGEAAHLASLGIALISENQLDNAINNYQQAIQIADEIGFVQIQNEARYSLAFAFLINENLSDAEHTINACSQYNYPPNDHQVLVLQGIVAIRQGDHKTAHQAFSNAIEESKKLLAHSEKNFKTLDTKALACCGLALSEKDKEHLKEAKNAYQSSREIIKTPGVVKRVLRSFDELAKADTEGMLKEVRAVAAGKLV